MWRPRTRRMGRRKRSTPEAEATARRLPGRDLPYLPDPANPCWSQPMTAPQTSPSRRDFLKTGGIVAAATAFSQTAVPLVHAGESNTIQVALVGCGGRGTGAAANALQTTSGPIKLVAMADVFDYKLKNSYDQLHKEFCCSDELLVED